MDVKAQEEAERERKREAIRQRIAAAKAAATAEGDAKHTNNEQSDAQKQAANSSASSKPAEDREAPPSALQERGESSTAAASADCYDVDPASFPSLPLPTKEAGDPSS